MMIRASEDRGKANFSWLDSKHTFSFGEYYDPNFMGFSHLRVINEDKVLGGKGFASHGHRDMEIITYVLQGALEHQDSLGSRAVMRYGDVQRMSAGTGIIHSEYNASATDLVHLLQIWIIPNQTHLSPSYEQKQFSIEEKRGNLCLIASPDGKQGSVIVHQDVYVYASILEKDQQINHSFPKERKIWLQVARGSLEVSEMMLQAGDGLAVIDGSELKIKGNEEESEFLLFDLA